MTAAACTANRLRIHPHAMSLARTVANECLELARTSLRRRGAFHVALAGGRTPETLYRALAASPRGATDWTRWHVFFGDERCVPPDHPASNQRMARRAWLDHVPVAPQHIHAMVQDPDQPEADARAYARLLEPLAGADGWPVLDLILLGIGTDGHTASLFPDTDILQVVDRPVAAVRHPADGGWRISLTRPVLARARSLWFLATGAGKAAVLARILRPATPSDAALPAALCNRPDAVWHMDRAAAGRLQS